MLADTDAGVATAKWDAHSADYARLVSLLTGHIARTMVAMVQDRLPGAPRILDRETTACLAAADRDIPSYHGQIGRVTAALASLHRSECGI